ncbi:MAG: hypothetical protein AAGF33_01555 [Pseudomonadota bacterium]
MPQQAAPPLQSSRKQQAQTTISSSLPHIDHYLQSEFARSTFSKLIDMFDGCSQTDIKLLLAPDSACWEIRGFVKNLFNNNDITRVLPAGHLVGRFREVVIMEPHTYRVEATIRFL